jgi:hypothetical protein
MKKRRRTWFFLALAVLVIGTTYYVVRRKPEPGEPAYAGRPLSEWLQLHLLSILNKDDAGRDHAAEATKQIGTNAIPFLLRWMRDYQEPPSWRVKCYETIEPVARSLGGQALSSRFFAAVEPRMMHGFVADQGFCILGPEAKAAIPDLTRLMNDPTRPRMADRAAYALAHLGEEAIPPLLSTITNQKAPMRVTATRYFSFIGTNAGHAAPIFQNLLSDQDPDVRRAATNVLRRIAPQVLTNAPPI